MSAIRLTMTQALARALAAQRTVIDGREAPLVAGVWAIFGHGNVAALGEALWQARDALPTFRGHNEQAMALAAVGFARASRRRRFMACASSIGPGATNMVTAAATAHVNRLPLLLLPADVFASRRPDPVLQQVESFADATVTANDCLRPVSRYFDRIARPEQILDALPRALAALTDPAACGPATLALCQDVQAEAFDCPRDFLEPRVWTPRRPPPDTASLAAAASALAAAERPLLVAGGGAFYADAPVAAFAERHGVPVVETQAGKGALPGDSPLNLGGIGGGFRQRRRQCPRRRGRPRARRRQPPDRCLYRVARPAARRRASRRPQRQPRRRRQTWRAAARRRRRGGPRTAVGTAGRLARRAGVAGPRRRCAPRLGRCGARRGRAGQRAAPLRRASRRRRPARKRPQRHRGRRRRRPSRRAAQTLAGRRARRLSRRIRLFLHGIRNRRRARREDGAARPPRHRSGRRRFMADDEL